MILSCLRGALEPAQQAVAESVTVYADDGTHEHHHRIHVTSPPVDTATTAATAEL